MAGPWEDYQPAAPSAGPWADYAKAEQSANPPGVSGISRFVRGLRDPIDGGAQLLTKILPDGVVQAGNKLNNFIADKTGLVGRLPEGGVDQQVKEGEAAYQSARGSNAGFDAARLAGNVLSPTNLAIAARTPQAVSMLGRVGLGAAGGAASSALNPITGNGDFGDEKLKQVATGAAFGGAVPMVTGALGRVVSPNASTNPNVALLRGEGVDPTIGQTLGGWANKVEEKAMSVPIMGDMISHARDTARRQFNEAAINRATNPIGVESRGVGQGAVQQAGNHIDAAYDAARAAMGSFRIDQQGAQELGRIRTMVNELPPAQQTSFNNTLNAIRTDISPNGTISADVYKRIDSRISGDAARFSGSQDPYHRQLGDALTALQETITGSGRRSNPQADAMFTAADRAHANMVRVEGAAKAAMNTEGVFTPGQLNMAVRQADQSVRDRATARGTALMQDLGNAGQQVLGNKVPNSGTADRLMLGGAGLGAYLVNPAIPAGLLGGAAMYTGPMQGLLRGAVASRPQSAQEVAEALRRASPGLVPLGAQMGLGLLN